jgi:altronate dehydratase small subunit
MVDQLTKQQVDVLMSTVAKIVKAVSPSAVSGNTISAVSNREVEGTMTTYKTVLLNAADNVAVALEAIPAGARVRLQGGSGPEIDVVQPIEFGHKFAVRAIRSGEAILKYGEVIGVASRDIGAGEHVHVHNLEGVRGRGDRK